MSLTDQTTINGLLGFASDEEREEFGAERLQLDILHTVSVQMQRSKLSKSELAARLGVSKSYISQLFAGDTSLNLRTLAKMERVLGGRFRIGMTSQTHNFDPIDNWSASDTQPSENVVPFLLGGSEFQPHRINVAESDLTQQEVC